VFFWWGAQERAAHPVRDGRPIEYSVLARAFREAREAAGVPELLIHDLRRSAIRNMVRAGVRRDLAMKISGHVTESVFERYNVTSAEDLSDAMGAAAAYHQQRVAAAAAAQPQPAAEADGGRVVAFRPRRTAAL
jgi:integrase